MLRFAFVLALIANLTTSLVSADESWLEKVRPFLKQHCYECHGAEKQKSELRFDTLGTSLTQRETLATWQAILDELNLGSMPPESQPQPKSEEIAAIVETLSTELRQAYAKLKSVAGKTVARRLNRFEVRSTLRDLLYLEDHNDFRPDMVPKLEDRNGNGVAEWSSNDPTREFPADQLEEGFDNIGGKLVMSDFLLTQMINAAEYSLKLATYPQQKPKLETRRFAAPIRKDGPGGSFERWSQEVDSSFDGIYERYREPGAAAGGLGRVSSNELAHAGVGVAGRYRITIEASAHNQQHPWGDLIKSRQEEPLLLGLHISDARTGGMNDGNPNERLLTEWAMTADGVERTYTFETWLGDTWLPWIGWENAPISVGCVLLNWSRST